MRKNLNIKFAVLAGIFAFAAVANAQTPPVDPPPWWGTDDGFTTSNCFFFDTANTPFEAEEFINPFGTPTGWVSEGDPVWLETFMGRDGVYCLDEDPGTNPDPDSPFDELTLDIPNLLNPDFYKDWWLQIVFKQEANSALQIVVSPNNVFNPFDIVDLGDGWFMATATGQIWPQPDVEWVEFQAIAGTTYIDQVYFGTHCSPVPEPATMAGLGLGAIGLLRMRRRKK